MIATKPTLRRSEVANLASCGAWQSDESEAARFGSLVHTAISTWTRAMCADPSRDKVLAMEDAVLFATLTPAGVGAERFGELRELARRFAETHDAHPETLQCVEAELQWEGANVVLTGTPDRVDRVDAHTLLVSDWKTAWASDEASAAFQLRWYAALLFLADERLEFVVCRTDHVRLGEEQGIDEWTATRDYTLAWWHGEIVPLAESIVARGSVTPNMTQSPSTEASPPAAGLGVREDDPLAPVGGAACAYCRLRWSCPESVAPYRNAPQTAEDARRIFAETVRLEAGVEERRKALKLWYAEHEPEVVNGLEVGFMQSRDASFKPRVPAAEIAAFLDQRGMDGARVLSLDSAQLRNKAMVSLLVENELGVLEHGVPTFKSRKATG